MIRNFVTISLIVFIIVVVGILGATVIVNQGKTGALTNNVEQINTNPGSGQGNINISQNGDEDNNPGDEEGEDGFIPNNNGVTTPVNTPPVNTPPVSTTPPSTSGITLAQVAQHNTRSSCWMVISNKVYNFASYMNAHPGGVSTILPLCGKDGTAAFATKGGQGAHSQTAYSLLANYFVANLVK